MKAIRTAAAIAAMTFATSIAVADTLELADGSLLEGDFVGSSNGIIMFNTGEGIEAFPEAEVVGLFLSAGVETKMQQAEQQPQGMTIPAGTRLVIRMSDTLDSSRHGSGHRFRGQLESALQVNGQTVVPRGTMVHGRITNAQQAGRVVGSSNLSMEFTDLMIDDVLVPIRTGELRSQGTSQGGRTAGTTARAAAIGALVSGSSGAKRGARIGAGASILTRGASINVPRGTVLETSLAAPLTVF
ncbi:MAG: hypothetical protein AAGE01_18345 [Pseudomonadota bacterium]